MPADAGLVAARVVNELGPEYRLLCEAGELEAVVAGKLAPQDRPAVGDWVLADATADRAVIQRTLARRTKLSRNAAGRAAVEQVLAANVDVIFLIQGLDGDFNLRRIERSLAAIWASGAEPVLLLNKADLVEDPAAAVESAREVAPGVEVQLTCALEGEGVEAVRARLGPGRTGLFLGSSGAGKSTLLNALAGDAVQVTAAVSDYDGRGRHTTTRRQLFVLPDGSCVIDVPGIRELQLWDVDDGGLERTFEDIASLAQGCRFADCQHEAEPACAVREAVEQGTLEAARLESFHKLRREAQRLAARHDVAARIKQKQDAKRFGRILKEVKRLKR